MATRMQQRRGTATMWTNANPILGVAEIGYETNTNKFKIGDGTNRWSDLNYFVDLDTMIEGAPGLLNSLDEIAAAIGDDPAFFTTIASGLATKAPLASPALTGTPTAPTAAADTNTTQIATTAFAKAEADAAQSAAEATASADATSKANAAQSAAEATASADATSKANAAKSGAEATAAAALTSAISTEVSNRNTAIADAVDDLVDGAPALLNTLNELAAAINDDANYTTTITTALGTKAPLASPALTGVPTAPTAAANTDTTQVATTAFAKAEADAAQSAAEATASADATSKANAAQAAAISAAATDATTKANNAKSGAEATAASALSSHEADTTNVHGIADTALLATKAYADNAASVAVASVIDTAPAALNTLNELAAALGDDENYASTITSALALKAPLASPTFTGTVSGVTKSMVGLGSVDNTTDANKPVSTASQAALDLKLNAADIIDGGGV